MYLLQIVVFATTMMMSLVLAEWPRSDMKYAFREDFPTWAALFGEDDD